MAFRRWFQRSLPAWLVFVGAFVALFTHPWDTDGLGEFRGTLHCGMAQIGGETTGVVIATPRGTYELAVKDPPKWRYQ